MTESGGGGGVVTTERRQVSYWEYLPDYAQYRQEVLAIVDRVFSSGRLILGPEVERFERRFADYCGAAFGVGVNSCTDALFLALKALGVGPGDEVITVANTAVPTVAAIRATGALPVFVDVEPDTYLMDVPQAARAVTPQTRCLLPVHLCGQAADMAAVMSLAEQRGLAVVEDCAQAAGARYADRRVGSFGAIGAFSFYPTKVLGGFGDGGVATTSSPDLAERLRRLRFYGMAGSYYAEEEGYNSRLDEVQAALLSYRLDRLDEEVAARQLLAARYDAGLSGIGDLALPAVRADRDHRYYLYTIRTSQRDELQKYLAGEGIETKVNYPWPIHLMRGYRFLGYREGSLPVTEQLASEILSLPMYGSLPIAHVERVIEAVRDFFR
jgi:dTDP-4-amino-4,6-dideoxygalactose transaminase